MARRAFYSFHYVPDNWRASQVRAMGVVEGNRPCSDNDWEAVTKGGDKQIEKWIADQMDGKSCVIVLVGTNTARRKWITHEIVKGWNDKKGVLGIHIHKLLDSAGKATLRGENPFSHIAYGETGKMLSSIVKTYDPPQADSKLVYDYIKTNLSDWIEEAISIRNAK